MIRGQNDDHTPPKMRTLGAELLPLLLLSSRFDQQDHLNQSGD